VPRVQYHNAGWLEGGVNFCLTHEVGPMINFSEHCAPRLMGGLLAPDNGILAAVCRSRLVLE